MSTMGNVGQQRPGGHGGLRGSLRRHRRWWVFGAAALALTVLVTTVVVTSGRRDQPGQAAPTSASQRSTSGNGSTGGSVTPGGIATPGNTGGVLPVGLRLSPGAGPGAAAASTPVTDGTPLDQQTLARLLGRLPAWSPSKAGGTDYRWPAQTIKKPETTQQSNQQFPSEATSQNPPQKPTATPAGPLTVLRIQPEGTVKVAPNLSITFSQPMVPITTVGQLKDRKVPARLSPDVAGRWEWIGTSTLRFVAETGSKQAPVDRLPMATDYTVTIPAGTASQSGNKLAAAVTATFSTPPPGVASFSPGDDEPVGRRPVLVAVFDQHIDPEAVLGKLSVTADGKAWPVRQATKAEIDADDAAARQVAAATPGRAIAVVPEREFPVGAVVKVSVGAATPSAEGPLTSTAARDFTFSVYGELTLTSSGCDSTCEPGGGFGLTFSNPIDEKVFDPATVGIEPKLPGASIVAVGDRIMISGPTKANAEYRVRVGTGLLDEFGQHLAEPVDTTVTIGPARQQLSAFTSPVTTVDPLASAPTITVNSAVHRQFRVRVYAVQQSDWPAFRSWYAAVGAQRDSSVTVPGWEQLAERTVDVVTPGDTLSATPVDLSDQLTDQRRQVVVMVEPTERPTGDDTWNNRPSISWVQRTTLGIDTFADASNAATWATDLRTGKPLAGVSIALIGSNGEPAGASVTTAANGLATLPLSVAGGTAILATWQGQQALLPADLWAENAYRRLPRRDRLLWYLTDDRQTYRPGETVSVKGWVRRQSADPATKLTLPEQGTATWTANDGNGVQIGKGTAELGRTGGFDFTIDLPDGANLGTAQVTVSLAGGVDTGDGRLIGDHSFTIADFRTPAFELSTRRQDSTNAVRGNDLGVQAAASYYAGGPLGATPVGWQVRTASASYAPPGWTQFSFGRWQPWWFSADAGGRPGDSLGPDEGYPGTGSDADVQTFDGTTDANGTDYLNVQVGDLGPDNAGLPVTVTAQAQVTDVNRQQIADSTDILVHPADYYVGLASDGTFVRKGQPLTVNAVATGIDGTAVAGRTITVTAAKVTTSWTGGRAAETLTDKRTCTVRSAATPVPCTFQPADGGQYRITATVTDDRRRTSRSEISRWVAGVDDSLNTGVDEQALTVIPDKKQYRPGDTAVLLVQGPIATGSGLLTLSHNGIAGSYSFTVANGSAEVRVPITDELLPSVTVNAEVVGVVPRGSDPGNRPAYATGRIDLDVSTAGRKLAVTAKPRQSTVAPGGDTTIDVSVKDAAGNPVSGSEFEIVVVDEAVLAQSDYQLADPLGAFYPRSDSWLDARYGRSLVMLGQPPRAEGQAGDSADAMATGAASSGASGGAPADAESRADRAAAPAAAAPDKSAAGEAKIQLRSNFDALALFRPSVVTGADGTAAVPVTVPDNLTRYRIMVVAASGTSQFGTGESAVTAGLPLTVRPTAPRFLNFGDKAELPVLVQNTTNTPQTAQVALQGANVTVAGAGSGATAATGKQVQVPAGGRVEVRFPVAADRAGTARFRIAVAAAADPGSADAVQIELPVYTPSTSEGFASYGTLEANSVLAQRLQTPTGVIDAFGGLQVSTSSTALTRLSDALGYLAEYDYGSSDALATQVLAIASVGSVLQSFSIPELPSPDALRKQVNGNVDTLVRMQNDDGGYPYWTKGDKSQPFNSIQATQALLVAKANGFDGSSAARRDAAVQRALPYLEKIDAALPAEASRQTRDVINAYALAVRSAAGQSVTGAADKLAAERGAALPISAVAWLLPVVSDGPRAELLRLITNAAADDAGSVTFTEKVVDDSWTVLQSDPRTDALVLDALLAVKPDSDLVGKVVKGLMSQQRGGRWNNLQDNAFVLMAVRSYYDRYEKADPDFVGRVWLGDTFAGEHTFTGRSTEQATLNIPTAELTKRGDTAVTLANKGSGRMYYRLSLATAPSDLDIAALDRGFVVSRSYSGVDDPGDVTRDAKGVWHIKAGARVRVNLTMVSRSARSHVALTDPLPAGLEGLNAELATTAADLGGAPDVRPAGETAGATGAGAATSVGGVRPNGYWYDHQNLRDDRAEAFTPWLQGGVYSYSYLAAATVPGTFVVPPTKAEQRYAPETFGRSGSDRVVIG